MLAQIGLQTGLDVTVPLLKPLEHPIEKFFLVLEAGGQVVHIGVRLLALQPDLRVRAARSRQARRKAKEGGRISPNDVLYPAAIEAHEHKVLDLACTGMLWFCLVARLTSMQFCRNFCAQWVS